MVLLITRVSRRRPKKRRKGEEKRIRRVRHAAARTRASCPELQLLRVEAF